MELNYLTELEPIFKRNECYRCRESCSHKIMFLWTGLTEDWNWQIEGYCNVCYTREWKEPSYAWRVVTETFIRKLAKKLKITELKDIS